MLCLYFVYTSCLLRAYFEFSARKNRTICVYVVGANIVNFSWKMQVFGQEFSGKVKLYFEQNHDGLQSRDSEN